MSACRTSLSKVVSEVHLAQTWTYFSCAVSGMVGFVGAIFFLAAHQHRAVIEVLPGVVKKVGGEHDIHPLLDHLAIAIADPAESSLQIGNLIKGLEESLLIPGVRGAPFLVLQDVVVVRPVEGPTSQQPLDERTEVQVRAPA